MKSRATAYATFAFVRQSHKAGRGHKVIIPNRKSTTAQNEDSHDARSQTRDGGANKSSCNVHAFFSVVLSAACMGFLCLIRRQMLRAPCSVSDKFGNGFACVPSGNMIYGTTNATANLPDGRLLGRRGRILRKQNYVTCCFRNE